MSDKRLRYRISCMRADVTITFAAGELAKYIRMMMPRCGNIPTVFDGEGGEGVFRLGLYEDFGLSLPSEVKDSRLDDSVYADTSASGGIIAGDNPRSVLLAVYEYLRRCGCVWLFPGPDGESIPNLAALPSVSFEKTAHCRYRGQCNEGSETQRIMLEAIDFTPKVGMNTFMQEFDIPCAYYNCYYNREHASSPAEKLTDETILQWKRECEAEIAKRGLLYHDMGHGWTAFPFGLPNKGGWESFDDDVVPEETREYLALRDGHRGLYNGVPLNTNICMSNPKARSIVANAVADYAEAQNNVDFLHIWLADASNNHCECEECAKKTVSDWYMMLMNEIDAELTERGLETHIVFIVYVDTVWPPVAERLNNPSRFSMLFAPITRSYTETYMKEADISAVTPYVRNHLSFPNGMAEYLGYLDKWQETFDGDCFCYEYHFWINQYFDLGGMFHARLISEDVRGLASHRLMGMVEDGSQRNGFPTGFPMYVYGRTLSDNGETYEELKKEYFTAAFGDEWKRVSDYLEALSDVDVIKMFHGEAHGEETRGRFEKIRSAVTEFLPYAAEHINDVSHARSVSWRILVSHGEAVLHFLSAIDYKLSGDTDGAAEEIKKIEEILWQVDLEYPGCCDSMLVCRTFERILGNL